jgi:hypothetical protein
MDELLEEYIQQNVIVRNLLKEELDSEELQDVNQDTKDESDKILVNNYADYDVIQNELIHSYS